MTYQTRCPLCNSDLVLAYCICCNIRGVYISEDGFCLDDAKSLDTTGEVVHCSECGWAGPLTELDD